MWNHLKEIVEFIANNKLLVSGFCLAALGTLNMFLKALNDALIANSDKPRGFMKFLAVSIAMINYIIGGKRP